MQTKHRDEMTAEELSAMQRKLGFAGYEAWSKAQGPAPKMNEAALAAFAKALKL